MRSNGKFAVTGLAWFVALTMASPILVMALTAFKNVIDANQFPLMLPFVPTLDNIASAFADASVTRALLNSVVESFGATFLCFLLALPAAYALAFHMTKGRSPVLLGMLMTRFMPGIGMVIPMYLIFKAIGLIDTQFGLVLIYTSLNLPIVTFMAYSSMRDIPREILDSASIDGATIGQQFFVMVIPLCRPGLYSAALVSIVLCWNEAFWSIQMTSSKGVPLSAYVATLSGDSSIAKLAAVSLIATAPMLLIGWLAQRQFARGLTFGAVK
jgi:sorbitol/mannitol transport system permease protein